MSLISVPFKGLSPVGEKDLVPPVELSRPHCSSISHQGIVLDVTRAPGELPLEEQQDSLRELLQVLEVSLAGCAHWRAFAWGG